jgi:hypothetical protein
MPTAQGTHHAPRVTPEEQTIHGVVAESSDTNPVKRVLVKCKGPWVEQSHSAPALLLIFDILKVTLPT